MDPPSRIVEITYDVASDVDTVAITLEMSRDGGESWNVPVQTVEGDVGPCIEPGQGKRILWDAGADFPDQISDRMQARVTADDVGDFRPEDVPDWLEVDLDNNGQDAGGGMWSCEVGVRCFDFGNHPAGTGYQVTFSVRPDVATIERSAIIEQGLAHTTLTYSSANTFSEIEISASIEVPRGQITAVRQTTLPLQGGVLSLMVDPEGWRFDEDNPEAQIRIWTVLVDGHNQLINQAPILFNSERGRLFWRIAGNGQFVGFFPDPARKLTGVQDRENNEESGQATVFLISREDDLYADPFTVELPVEINARVEGYEDVQAEPMDVLFIRE